MQAGIEHGVGAAQVRQLRQVAHPQIVAVDDRAAILRGDASQDVE